MKTCEHVDLNFAINHNHFGDTNVHTLDIKITCNTCGKNMRFLGMSLGVSMAQPSTDPDGFEARIPIVAEDENPDSQLGAFLRAAE